MYTIRIDLIEGYPQPRAGVCKKAMQLYTDGKLTMRAREIPNWHMLDWLIGKVFGIYPHIHSLDEHSWGGYTAIVAQGIVTKAGEHKDRPLCKLAIRIKEGKNPVFPDE